MDKLPTFTFKPVPNRITASTNYNIHLNNSEDNLYSMLASFIASNYDVLSTPNGVGKFNYEFFRLFLKEKESFHEHALLVANAIRLSVGAGNSLLGFDVNKSLSIHCCETEYGLRTTLWGSSTMLVIKTVLHGELEDLPHIEEAPVKTKEPLMSEIDFGALLVALKNAKEMLVDKDYHWAAFTRGVFKANNTHLLEARYNNQTKE